MKIKTKGVLPCAALLFVTSMALLSNSGWRVQSTALCWPRSCALRVEALTFPELRAHAVVSERPSEDSALEMQQASRRVDEAAGRVVVAGADEVAALILLPPCGIADTICRAGNAHTRDGIRSLSIRSELSHPR